MKSVFSGKEELEASFTKSWIFGGVFKHQVNCKLRDN